MPKSRRRKGARYTPHPRAAVPASGGAPAPARNVQPAATAPTGASQARPGRLTPGAGLGYVRTELKVIALTAGAILVGIVALYFGLR